MKKYEIKLKIVTPCIMAGNDQKKAEFRAPSIRGQLRHWFRVLYRDQGGETALFGGTGGGESGVASQVIVRVKTPASEMKVSSQDGNGISGNPFDYFLWPLRNTKKDPDAGMRGVLEPQSVELVIIDKSRDDRFEKSLKAFLYLGSLGTRSRRAYGSVYPEKVVCNGCKWKLPSNVDEFVAEINNLGNVNISVLSIASEADHWHRAVQFCAEFLKSFRCGSEKSGTPSKWGKNDHDIVFNNSGINYRAAIGLPLMQRYSQKGTYQTSINKKDPAANKDMKAKNDRWASPVCFKVVELGGGFVPLAIFLEDFTIPVRTKVTTVNNQDRKYIDGEVSHDLLHAMMDPGRHNEAGWQGAQRLV